MQSTQQFQSRMAAFDDVAKMLEAFAQRVQLTHGDLLRMRLLLEELFTNTVRHGMKGDSTLPVSVTLEASEHSVELIYEDCAPEFNPFVAIDPPDVLSSIDTRCVGGLGVLIATSMTTRASYAFVGGRNRIRLTLPRDATSAGR
jgi:serine/threonine-protein kinase RsbW